MRCEEYHGWLSAYLDGELEVPDVRSLEEHLTDCQRCAAELASLRGSVRLLHMLATEEPPEGLRDRIMTAIAATHPSPWHRVWALLRAPALRPAWGLAAAGAAVTLLTVVTTHRPGPLVSTKVSGQAAAPRSGMVALPFPPESPGSPARSTRRDEPLGTVPRTDRRPAVRSPISPSTIAMRPRGEDAKLPGVTAIPRTPPLAKPPAASNARLSRPAARRLARWAWQPKAARRPRVRAASFSRWAPPSRRPETPAGPPSSYAALDAREPATREPGSATSPGSPVPPAHIEEPTTMMASMSGMPDDGSLDGSPRSDDPLASLRQRLADQRREVPRVEVESSRDSGRVAPVVIQF